MAFAVMLSTSATGFAESSFNFSATSASEIRE
jgi:hypothetical protein